DIAALRPRAREPRNARIARREAQVRERLLADDAVGLERSASLKGDDASAEPVVEDVVVLGCDRSPVQIAQTLPHPFHVLAARAWLDRERAKRRSLPEDDERAIPVSVHRDQRQGVASP